MGSGSDSFVGRGFYSISADATWLVTARLGIWVIRYGGQDPQECKITMFSFAHNCSQRGTNGKNCRNAPARSLRSTKIVAPAWIAADPDQGKMLGNSWDNCPSPI